MREATRKSLLHLFILLQLLSMVKCLGYTFQRIDKNDDGSMAAGFTMIFHQCTFDSGCNFVAKRNKGSELEKIQNTEDSSKYYNIWKKSEKKIDTKDEVAVNVALNKPASMSSIYKPYTAASNAVDGNRNSGWQQCALTKMELSSPWLLVDLLSEYHIRFVRIKNRDHEISFRSQPFDVRVGNNNQNGGIANGFCVQQGRIPTLDTLMRFDCPLGTRGRYVSFHTPPNTSCLELCEFEAYGVKE